MRSYDTRLNAMRFARIALILACLSPVACTVTTSGSGVAQPSEPQLYYYGGPHYFSAAFGGEWCGIAEPHAHDFPPDHPEFYSYENHYYYYVGPPGQPQVPGRTPADAHVHVAQNGDPHGARPLPAEAPPAPHTISGQIPTREGHPAPMRPLPAPARATANPATPANPVQAPPASRPGDPVLVAPGGPRPVEPGGQQPGSAPGGSPGGSPGPAPGGAEEDPRARGAAKLRKPLPEHEAAPKPAPREPESKPAPAKPIPPAAPPAEPPRAPSAGAKEAPRAPAKKLPTLAPKLKEN